MTAGRPPIPHLRWWIALLLCLASAVNYLDRQTLSVLAVTLREQLRFGDEEYADITSAFLASYAVMYLVGGWLVDRLGTRLGLLLFASGWSVATALHGLARTAWHLAAGRFLLGAAAPACFPAGVRAVAEWFPMRERALAVGVFNAGTALGSTLALPLVTFLALQLGWRGAFAAAGALGLVWTASWAFAYRLPAEHPRLGAAERALIESGRKDGRPAARPAVPLRRLLARREVWGCVLARVLTDPVSYFLAFWIPSYLQQERNFTLAELGSYAWIPYLALVAGNLASGAIPRLLMARGWSLDQARKGTMLAVSLAMPLFCLGVVTAGGQAAALAWLAALMFGHAAWGNITLPAEVFPQTVIGTVTGLGGALGSLAGIAAQQATGRVVAELSYAPIFAAVGGVYLVALIGVQLLIGRLGEVREV